jgi:hypothetical protein
MKYLQGQDREQLHIFPVTMEAAIGADNEVRMIELFVEGLSMEELGLNRNSRWGKEIHQAKIKDTR